MELEKQLTNKGIQCWIDEKNIIPGDDLFDAIDYGLNRWDKVLLCCSESSLSESWWVDHEVKKTLQKEARLTREQRKKWLSLIPIAVDNYIFSEEYTAGIKSELLSRAVADFTNWQNKAAFSSTIFKLVQALRINDNDSDYFNKQV